MSTTNLLNLGQSWANGGWITSLTNPAVFDAVGSQYPFLGPNNGVTCYFLLRFTIPSVTGPVSSRSLTFSIPVQRGTGGPTSTTIRYKVTDANRTETSYFTTPIVRGTVLAEGSFSSGTLSSTIRSQSFTTGEASFQNGSTYYLWLTADAFMHMHGGASFYAATLNYTATTKMGEPSNVKVNGVDSHVNYVPGATVRITWTHSTNGAANNLSQYVVEQSINGRAWTACSPGVTTTNAINVSLHSTRGEYVYYRVKAQGSAGAAYDSGYTGSVNAALINSLPATPSVSTDKTTVPSAGGNVTFTLSGAAAGEDYYYSSTSGGSKISIGSSVTLSVTSPSSTYYFYIKDDLEYGGARSSTVYRNSAPAAPTISITANTLAGTSGVSGVSLCLTVASGTMSLPSGKSASSYHWYIQYGTTSSSLGSEIYFSDQKSFSNLTPSLYTGPNRGNYFRIAACYNDGIERSAYAHSSTYRIPLTLGVPTLGVINNSSTATSNIAGTATTEFENGLYARWKNPTVGTGQTTIKEAAIVYRITSNNGASYSQYYGGTMQGSTAGGADTGSTVYCGGITRGYKVQISVWVTDQSGYQTTATYSNLYMRANAPSISNLQVTGPETGGVVTFKPLSTTQTLTIKTAAPQGNNGAKWYIRAYIPSKSTYISLRENLANPVGTTKTFSIVDINALLKNTALLPAGKTKHNGIFTDVQYQVYIIDNFGIYSNVLTSSNTRVDFRETPKFATGTSITAGIQYNINNPTTDFIKKPSTLDTGDNIKNNRIIVDGEWAVVEFPLATDLNEDIVHYRIRIGRLHDAPSISQSADYYSGVTFEDWLIKTPAQLITNGSNRYIQERLPLGAQNQFIVFEVAAVDSYNLVSASIYSNTYLIQGRAEQATINISSSQIVENGSNQSLKVDFTIPYFGQGNFINYPDYSDYPIFGRNLDFTEGTIESTIDPFTIFGIQYTLDGNFNNTNPNNYGIYYHVYSWDYVSSISITTTALSSQFKNKRLFVRVMSIFGVGLGSATYDVYTGRRAAVSYSPSYAIYITEPTMSYRPNWVGINNNQVEEDEVFRVSDYGEGKRFITFIGVDGDNTTFKIRIDLKTGSIDGATISGGAW